MQSTDKTISAAPSGEHTGLYGWIVRHDESILFVIAYIALAVVLSIWISLFWLVAVISVHFAFEIIRQTARFNTLRRILLEALWEIKLDIALVYFALALALYMEVILGILGLQSAARMGAAARAGGRVLAWERILRGFALTIDDVFNVGRFIKPMLRAARANGQNNAADEKPKSPSLASEPAPTAASGNSWIQSWTLGDRISIGLGTICLLLIFAAPLFTDHTAISAINTLVTELHPFPRD